MKRRTFLNGALVAGAAGVAVGAGLLPARAVLAADAPAPAASPFSANNVDDVLKALNLADATASDEIKIKAPEIAENGAVVPLTVSTTLAGASKISIVVNNNPTPLAASFNLLEGASPEISTRIKMGKSSDVVAYVTAGDKTYMAKQEVKVTLGGCGG